MGQESIICVTNVYKSYGSNRAVAGLHFAVSESICFGLLGPNGAGKTTMMGMIYGVGKRDVAPAGKISVFGFDPAENPLAIKFQSGVVPQENNLDDELNVEQNLQVFSKFYNIPKKIAQKRINELLAFMELSDKHRSKIRQLSGGMKRRLIIARALLNNPRLLVLDEPTTGLDPQVRHLIWDKLRVLKKQGMTILLTTHYMEEAFQICDSVLIMNKGECVLEGNPKVLVRDSIESYVVEIYNHEAFKRIESKLGTEIRAEVSSGMARLYSNNERSLRDLSGFLQPGDYYMHQSNLEDLFLKTTGSVLNAQQ